jgi:hypothetical protein
MDRDVNTIADLMNRLADARATLDACLSHLPADDTAGRRRVADTIKEIDNARLNVLNHFEAKGAEMDKTSSPGAQEPDSSNTGAGQLNKDSLLVERNRLALNARVTGGSLEAAITQAQFDRCVDDYNEDYLLVLRRASSRHYNCLVTSFSILKDFYDLISTLYDNGGLLYHKLPHPFTVRADDQLLSELGFNADEIANIYDFLPYVKLMMATELEDYLNSGKWGLCVEAGAP